MLNHLGEKEFSTFGSWRAACKKAGATRFEGDKDICQAFAADKWVGEWDGATGQVMKMTTAYVKVGDRVNALFYPDTERDGVIVAIDGHIVTIKVDSGEVWNTPQQMVRKL